MLLNELTPFPEERKDRKRIGRGRGTGQGCTAGKGNKGQNARAGVSSRPWFEGGQMPLARRLPKRGFKNPFKVSYSPINLDRLVESFPETAEITLDLIYERGLAPKGAPVKILGNGDLTKAITVEAHKFSASALEKLAKAGGAAKPLENVTEG
ncbi:50S ribosomal protein L15 [Fundidesulfovibrio magnetotacticus]|uniref:Large ribosomal subunit protein uL15 n=1 Tax=Fundidesulfovibrio magnetotacticus TaxID=2730080 RepID=A0A6V8M058_9BACT|nr:50S ribosomal protein L15 [Fundidesulfovibrio magnetotacticus]GFK95649.1 50S ribosomal protein L15 [Fundidesulfovibrio magnetotacticus]